MQNSCSANLPLLFLSTALTTHPSARYRTRRACGKSGLLNSALSAGGILSSEELAHLQTPWSKVYTLQLNIGWLPVRHRILLVVFFRSGIPPRSYIRYIGHLPIPRERAIVQSSQGPNLISASPHQRTPHWCPQPSPTQQNDAMIIGTMMQHRSFVTS
jgi:hypothetical protein